jgi:hypothetical protein
LWILVGLAALVGLSLLAGNLRTETREVVAYLDEAHIVADDARQQSDAYQALMVNDLAVLDRAEFDVLMQTIETAIVNDKARLEPIMIPDSAVAAGDMLDLALDSWQKGLDGVQRSILAVVDDPDGIEPVDQLSTALLDLQLGDLLYARFRERANALTADLDVTITEFAPVSFVADEPVLRNAALIARAVRQSTILGSRSDMAILSGFFVPSRTGGQTASGADILPATDTLSFGVVISNLGNQVEKGVVVQMRFLDGDGVVVSSATSPTVDLEPGEGTSVVFDPADVSPGRNYEVQWSIPLDPDDIDASNNSMSAQIAIGSNG